MKNEKVLMSLCLRKVYQASKYAALLVLLIGIASCETKVEVPKYGSIEGSVIDANTQDPIEGVSISTSPASSVILTDSEGDFNIDKVEVGEYSITAKKSGYRTSSVSANVLENETSKVTVTMEEGGGDAADLKIMESPATGTTEVGIDTQLSWSLSKSYSSPSYDVKLYNKSQSANNLIATDISDTVLNVEDLEFEATYYWQITIYNNGDFVANSEVWTFTTKPFPDNDFRFAREVNGSYEIFASTEDSTGERAIQLTDNSAGANIFPRLNPQRNLIAFTSNRTLDFQIYTMNRNGDNVQQITSLPVAGNHNNGVGYCWSPDGGKFLYSHFENLYAIDRNGTDRELIATAPPGRHFRMVDWTSQNGGKIIAQTMGTEIYNSELYIMNEDGSNMQLLVSNYDGRIESPTFSIDGKRVMYTRDANGLNSSNGRQLDSRIYTMNLDSTDVQDLSVNKPNGTNDLYPRYSPDGAHIIFVNTSNTGLEDPAVYMMDINGQSRKKLFDMATFPDWF